MRDYRYTLDKSSRKEICPQCGYRRFVLYIDTKTSEYCASRYGRCDREVECRYHVRPTGDKVISSGKAYLTPVGIIKERKKDFHDFHFLDTKIYNKITCRKEQTLYADNLVRWISKVGGRYCRSISEKQIERSIFISSLKKTLKTYHVGSYYHSFSGRILCFPLIDGEGYLHYVQTKKFDNFGHTLERSTSTLMALNKSFKPDFWDKLERKITCLFGEHQLGLNFGEVSTDIKVVVVEAPKTALLLDFIYNVLEGIGYIKDKPFFTACMSAGQFSLVRGIPEGVKIIGIPDFDDNLIVFSKWIRSKSFLRSHRIKIRNPQLPREKQESGDDIADIIENNPDTFNLIQYIENGI